MAIEIVSMWFDNFEEKLTWLLENEDETRRIGMNGKKLFDEGYSPRRTAEQIMDFFLKGGCA